jgi:hypothetical protein
MMRNSKLTKSILALTGIGSDRPFAYNIEVAVKFVWR